MNRTSQSNPPRSFFRAFREHPANVDETYIQHLLFASHFALRLFAAGTGALIHAVIPALCETTASRMIKAMHSDMEKRSTH